MLETETARSAAGEEIEVRLPTRQSCRHTWVLCWIDYEKPSSHWGCLSCPETRIVWGKVQVPYG